MWYVINAPGLRLANGASRTMAIIYSKRTLLSNIYVSSTSSSHAGARNTDGADTIYSDYITFDRWTVVNGDDSISLKANSTNIVISNSTFFNGLGVAIGSIGQLKGVFETVENVTVTDIVCHNTKYAAYIKTWTGQQVNYPPNGGGGGLGCECKNVSLKSLTNVEQMQAI
jgi:galacturan 1,4-alpha-galacturonidase